MNRRRFLQGAGVLTLGAVSAFSASTAFAASVEISGTDAGGFGFGDPLRPYRKSWMGVRLPDNALIDPNSAAVAAEIAQQATLAKPIVNVWADAGWTAEPLVVPANTPLVPVTMTNTGDYHTAAILKLGVPIPAGTVPPTQGEPTLTIWQPDYVNRYDHSQVGRLFELYKGRVDAASNWFCETGCRYWNVNNDTRAHSYSWVGGPAAAAYATDPDSTYTAASYTTGAGLPYMPTVLSLADCQRGYVDHVLGLEAIHSYGHVWPATRSDGATSTSLLHEGDRYRFPPGYVPPAGLHPLAKLTVQAGTDYGFVLLDMSGALAERLAPSAARYLNGAADYDVLNGFPWRDLQRLAVGSDTNQTPVGP